MDQYTVKWSGVVTRGVTSRSRTPGKILTFALPYAEAVHQVELIEEIRKGVMNSDVGKQFEEGGFSVDWTDPLAFRADAWRIYYSRLEGDNKRHSIPLFNFEKLYKCDVAEASKAVMEASFKKNKKEYVQNQIIVLKEIFRIELLEATFGDTVRDFLENRDAEDTLSKELRNYLSDCPELMMTYKKLRPDRDIMKDACARLQRLLDKEATPSETNG